MSPGCCWSHRQRFRRNDFTSLSHREHLPPHKAHLQVPLTTDQQAQHRSQGRNVRGFGRGVPLPAAWKPDGAASLKLMPRAQSSHQLGPCGWSLLTPPISPMPSPPPPLPRIDAADNQIPLANVCVLSSTQGTEDTKLRRAGRQVVKRTDLGSGCGLSADHGQVS